MAVAGVGGLRTAIHCVGIELLRGQQASAGRLVRYPTCFGPDPALSDRGGRRVRLDGARSKSDQGTKYGAGRRDSGVARHVATRLPNDHPSFRLPYVLLRTVGCRTGNASAGDLDRPRRMHNRYAQAGSFTLSARRPGIPKPIPGRPMSRME